MQAHVNANKKDQSTEAPNQKKENTRQRIPEELIQLAEYDPNLLTYSDILSLHGTIGNKAVGRLFNGIMQRKPQEETQKTSSPIDINSLSRADIMMLHSTIGNKAVGRLLNGAMQRKNPDKAKEMQKKRNAIIGLKPFPRVSEKMQSIQRMIISDNIKNDDQYKKVAKFLIEKKGASGKIVKPKEKVDITKKNPKEPIYILQHGSKPDKETPGTIMYWTPQKLLKILESMGFVPANHKGNITLLSCYSAFSMTGDPSFASRFSKVLKEKKYTGSISGVNGSLNPLGIKIDKDITVDNLSQGDPVYTRMDEIKTIFLKYSEIFYTIQDISEGEEKDNKLNETWQKNLKEFIDQGIYIIKICDYTTKQPTDIKDALGKWRKDFFNILSEIMKITKNTKKITELKNEDKLDLSSIMDKILSIYSSFENIVKGYIEKRKKEGYTKGMTSLFKEYEPVIFK